MPDQQEVKTTKDFLKRFTALRYWFATVFPRAFRDAILVPKIKDKLMDIIISLIVAVVFVAVYGNLRDPSLLNINPNTVVWVLAATFIFRFIVGLIRVPAEMDREKERGIAQLQEKWESEPINATLSIRVVIDNHPTRKHFVRVAVFNSTRNTLSHVRIRLKDGSCYCVKPSGERIPRLAAIRGSGGNFCDSETVISGREKEVDIAKVDSADQFIWIFPIDPPNPPIDAVDLEPVSGDKNIVRAVYEMMLEIDATIDEHPLITTEFELRISFTKESGLFNTRIVDGREIKQSRSPRLTILGEEIKHEQKPTET